MLLYLKTVDILLSISYKYSIISIIIFKKGIIIMKNYLIICSFLVICTIGNVFGACSDPAGPGVDWRNCDKSGIILGNPREPFKPINMKNALISGAKFDNAYINACFSDENDGLYNVSFINATIEQSTFDYGKRRIDNIDFTDATFKKHNFINTVHLINSNFINAVVESQATLSINLFPNTVGNTSFVNFKGRLIFNTQNTYNVDFTNANLYAPLGNPSFINSLNQYAGMNFTNSNLSRVQFPHLSLQEVNSSNSRFKSADLSFARLSNAICLSGSIGRCRI